MPVQIDWFNERDDIVHLQLAAPWGVNDLIEALDRSLEFYAASADPLSSIVDFLDGSSITPGIIAGLPQIARHPAITHKKAGTSVIILNPGIANDLSFAFSRLYFPVQFAQSIEQAVLLIDKFLANYERTASED